MFYLSLSEPRTSFDISYMEASEPWLFLSLLHGDLRTFVGLSFLSGALTTLIVLSGTLSTSIILSLLSGT